jgi:hypothetical protein
MKELAKFACGVTTGGFIVHLLLDLSDNLPITIAGLTILTSTVNLLLMIISGILSLVFAYYAWGKGTVVQNAG